MAARFAGRRLNDGLLVEDPIESLISPSLRIPHSDLYHSLLEIGWGAFLCLVVSIYVLSNMLFA